MNRKAFSLAELVLATGTIAACILTLMVLVLSLSRSSRKSVNTSAAELAADQILTRILYQADWNDHANFWDTPNHSPYRSGSYSLNRTDFSYTLDASEVRDTSSTAVGAGQTQNRLKMVNLRVTWWDGNSGPRAGTGKLSTQVQRLVHEKNH